MKNQEYKNAFLLLNGKAHLVVDRNEKFDEIRVTTDLKYLEDLKHSIFHHLKIYKFKKVKEQTDDKEVYCADSIEVQFSDFKNRPTAIINKSIHNY